MWDTVACGLDHAVQLGEAGKPFSLDLTEEASSAVFALQQRLSGALAE